MLEPPPRRPLDAVQEKTLKNTRFGPCTCRLFGGKKPLARFRKKKPNSSVSKVVVWRCQHPCYTESNPSKKENPMILRAKKPPGKEHILQSIEVSGGKTSREFSRLSTRIRQSFGGLLHLNKKKEFGELSTRKYVYIMWQSWQSFLCWWKKSKYHPRREGTKHHKIVSSKIFRFRSVDIAASESIHFFRSVHRHLEQDAGRIKIIGPHLLKKWPKSEKHLRAWTQYNYIGRRPSGSKRKHEPRSGSPLKRTNPQTHNSFQAIRA